MSDGSVAELLRSSVPLAVVEAPAGCGKTHQGAEYARDVSTTIGSGRLLVITHTHGACGVFADRTRGIGSRVEIRTIQSLIAQIACAYRTALGLPDDLMVWAWQNSGAGFNKMAEAVADLLGRHPMIASALSDRYPVVICDEYQDCSDHQHKIIMALLHGGARLRIFGDPLQWLFGGRSAQAARQHLERWDALKNLGAFDLLDTPHRWKDSSPELGKWILAAREQLQSGNQIDLSSPCPGLTILRADNQLQPHIGYRVAAGERKALDGAIRADQFMVLAGQKARVQHLNAFWGRGIPVWEGHTRPSLAELVMAVNDNVGDASKLAGDLVAFVSQVGVGFTPRSHGDRLLQEVSNSCARPTAGKPGNIQKIAKEIIQDPSHHGVSKALETLRDLVKNRAAGFDGISLDHKSELSDAIRLQDFNCPKEGYAEILRRRSFAMPKPPGRTISTIHKAKGLECDNAVIVAVDRDQFSDSYYSRCKLYVAISRARASLTLVVSQTNPSPLVRL